MLTVRNVTSCPTDEVSWNERAGKMNCESITQNCAMTLGLDTQTHRFQYHCLINSNMNATVEVCALSRYILGKHIIMFMTMIDDECTQNIKMSFLSELNV